MLLLATILCLGSTLYNLVFGDGSEFFLDNSSNHWFFFQEILDGNYLRSTFFQAVIPKWCQDSFDVFSYQVWQNHCIGDIRASLELSKLPSSHDAPLLVCRPRKLKIRTKRNPLNRVWQGLLTSKSFWVILEELHPQERSATSGSQGLLSSLKQQNSPPTQ